MILGFVVFRVGLERFFLYGWFRLVGLGFLGFRLLKGWGFVGLGVLIGF